MKRRRIHRRELASALTELFTVEGADGADLQFDGVPEFSLLDFLKPWLARKIEHEYLTIQMPSAITASITADSSGKLLCSLQKPIVVKWQRGIIHATVECFGFTEFPDRYDLNLTWAGMVPIPISISKPTA